MNIISKLSRTKAPGIYHDKIGRGWGVFFLLFLFSCTQQPTGRTVADFNTGWKFYLGDDSLAFAVDYDDSQWRTLNLPHDWSIEGEFSEEHPTRINGGALPAGVGWYRKSFVLGAAEKDKQFFIDFDGVYRNGEVWINGQYLGKRPFGYMGFRYDITQFLRFDGSNNILAVKVDNSEQPNSRWYTGSGIYRNVWLVSVGTAYVDHWGTFVTTKQLDGDKHQVNIQTAVKHASSEPVQITLKSILMDGSGKVLGTQSSTVMNEATGEMFEQRMEVENPDLWSFDTPVLYKLVSEVYANHQLTDRYETTFGFRYFRFDAEKGFFLNGKNIKLHGVNNHHDLGALGAAFNTRAAERQLEILKEMGAMPSAWHITHQRPSCSICATAWASSLWKSRLMCGPNVKCGTITIRILKNGTSATSATWCSGRATTPR
jgi:beta-galactosidase